jgi:hypothetical protein
MSWIKQVGNTKHMAWITRVAAEVEPVIFTVAHWTPDMPAALATHGRQTFDETIERADDPNLLEVLNRFADHWRRVSREDIYKAEAPTL